MNRRNIWLPAVRQGFHTSLVVFNTNLSFCDGLSEEGTGSDSLGYRMTNIAHVLVTRFPEIKETQTGKQKHRYQLVHLCNY